MPYVTGVRVPNLSGCVCTAFLIEESIFRGRVQNGLHAYYLQVNDNRWHRFGVGCRGIRWITTDTPCHPPIDDWQFRTSPIDDDRIIGSRIHRVDYCEAEPLATDSDNESEPDVFFAQSVIRIHFENAVRLEAWYRGADYELVLQTILTAKKQRKDRQRH